MPFKIVRNYNEHGTQSGPFFPKVPSYMGFFFCKHHETTKSNLSQPVYQRGCSAAAYMHMVMHSNVPRSSAAVAQITFECRMQHGGCNGPIKLTKMQEKATELHQSKIHAQVTVANFPKAAQQLQKCECAANMGQMYGKCAATVRQKRGAGSGPL